MAKIAVIGLDYIRLPLAVEFAKHYEVVRFDISKKRNSELKDGIDSTLEVDSAHLFSTKMIFTDDVN